MPVLAVGGGGLLVTPHVCDEDEVSESEQLPVIGR